jgi:hypothetical protein
VFEIKLDKKSLEHLEALERAPMMVGRAIAHFTNSIAQHVAEEVQRYGRVPGINYDDLEAVYFGKQDGFSTTALVLPDTLKEVNPNQSKTVVVTVQPREDSDFLRLLKSKSPWPMTMLPPGFENTDKAGLVMRSVTVEEVETQIARLLADIEVFPLMVSYGYISAADPRPVQHQACLERALPPGFKVVEDLAWKALRYEYGISGVESVPHWRKALRSAKDPEEEMLTAFWEVITGERRVGVPRRNTSMLGDIGGVENFQRYLSSATDTQRDNPR